LVFDTSDESGSVPDEDCCMLRLACTAAASAGLPYDALMALRGVSAPNACTGYALLPMPDAAFEEDFVYDAETGNYPAAYIMLPEPRLVAVGLPHGTTRIPVVCRLSIV
jgi:hypothetical protein